MNPTATTGTNIDSKFTIEDLKKACDSMREHMERIEKERVEFIANELSITLEHAKELLKFYSDNLIDTPYIPMMDTYNTDKIQWDFKYTVPILRSDRIPLIKKQEP